MTASLRYMVITKNYQKIAKTAQNLSGLLKNLKLNRKNTKKTLSKPKKSIAKKCCFFTLDGLKVGGIKYPHAGHKLGRAVRFK
jgi:hypothetical protein